MTSDAGETLQVFVENNNGGSRVISHPAVATSSLT